MMDWPIYVTFLSLISFYIRKKKKIGFIISLNIFIHQIFLSFFSIPICIRREILGSTLQHKSRSSCYLQCQHPRWVLVCVPAAAFLIHVFANGPGKAQKMAHMWETWMKFLTAGFCGCWRNESLCGTSLPLSSLFLYLPLFVILPNKQINKSLKRENLCTKIYSLVICSCHHIFGNHQ